MFTSGLGTEPVLKEHLESGNPMYLWEILSQRARAATEEDMLPLFHKMTALERTCSTSSLPEYTG